MAVQVIDAKGEIEQYIAATLEDVPGAPPPAEKPADAPTEPPETGGEPAVDPDDVEDEAGFTPRQKRELSAKMLKAVGKKHREMKEAEEFAAAQYAERRLAEQRAAALERENAELKAKAQPAASETAVDSEAGKPQRDKFSSDEAYWEAVIDWRADQRADKKFKEKAAEQAAEREKQRLADIETAARARISKALELVPDFKQVTEAVDAEVPPVVAGYMQKSEMFAELGYHLAKNPDVLAKIAKMPPDEQLVTIGKIEGTLKPFEAQTSKASAGTNGATPSEVAGKTGQRSTTAATDETGIAPSRARDAAPVIRPLNGSGAAPAEIDPRDMSIRETIADFSKRNKVNLGLRKRH